MKHHFGCAIPFFIPGLKKPFFYFQLFRVTAKYQITLPVKIRKELGIVPGAEVDIVKKGTKYVLVVDPIAEIRNKWRGKFKDESTTMAYLEQVRGPIKGVQ